MQLGTDLCKGGADEIEDGRHDEQKIDPEREVDVSVLRRGEHQLLYEVDRQRHHHSNEHRDGGRERLLIRHVLTQRIVGVRLVQHLDHDRHDRAHKDASHERGRRQRVACIVRCFLASHVAGFASQMGIC